MVMVPMRYDDVGDVWFVRICTLRGFAKGRFEHWYVLLAAFSSVNEDIRVLFPNDVGIGSLQGKLARVLPQYPDYVLAHPCYVWQGFQLLHGYKLASSRRKIDRMCC